MRAGPEPACVRWIGREPGAPAASLGGKAAGLDRLARAGFPVPAGFCLLAEAWQLHMAGAVPDGERQRLVERLPDEAARRALEGLARSSPMPEPVRAELAAALEELASGLAGGLLCVRSSASVEDSAEASHAGQYDSVVGIGHDAVEAAVRRCWASLWSPRALAYREQQGVLHAEARMAVLVQRFVEPRATALAFTANPVTGSGDELVVCAVAGRGEDLAAGAASGDTFVVDRRTGRIVGVTPAGRASARAGRAATVQRPQLALRGDELRELAGMCLRVEAALGRPADVEAVLGDAGWVLLQARPITGLDGAG